MAARELDQLQELIANFKTVTTDCDEVFLSRNAKYGTANISAVGIGGVISRMGDKLARLGHMDTHCPDESVDDALRDLANYARMALMLRQGVWPKMQLRGLVYLACPVDQGIAPPGVLEVLRLGLQQIGLSWYSPARAWSWSNSSRSNDETARVINRINDLALREADTIIAVIPEGTITYGTIAELTLAYELGKGTFPLWINKTGLTSSVFVQSLPTIYHTEGAVLEAIDAYYGGGQKGGEEIENAQTQDTPSGGRRRGLHEGIQHP